MYCDAEHFFSIHSLTTHTQADAQDFERLLMEEPLLMVRDLSVEFKDDTGETELLRNYEFNISQGIVQRVSRFFDALALMDERGEAPPARGEGFAGVMGFGRKRNVCNQERHPARRVAREQQDVALEAKVAAAVALNVTEQDAKVAALEAEVAALRAAEQVTKIAALEAEVAKLQALAAPSAALPPLQLAAPSAPSAPSAVGIFAVTTPCALRRSWLSPRREGGSVKGKSRSLASPAGQLASQPLLPRLARRRRHIGDRGREGCVLRNLREGG
jgi:hypothetical protein